MAASAEPAPIGTRLPLLKRMGYGELTHDSHVPFLSHLIGTRRLLVEWGARPALCDAGLFHSAYGTEYFQPDQPASRDEVRDLIGTEAEAIAWVWCTIRRDTLEPSDPATASDRWTEEPMPMSPEMVADIATLWAADTVEQIERMTPDERGFASGIERVLDRASPPAQAAAAAVLATLRSNGANPDDPT